MGQESCERTDEAERYRRLMWDAWVQMQSDEHGQERNEEDGKKVLDTD